MNSLIISPHLDDAVLSLGAVIAKLGRSGGNVTIATVLAGCDDSLISPLIGSGSIVTLRRIEDEEACALLGAHCVHLDILDAAFRTYGSEKNFCYDTWPLLFAGKNFNDGTVSTMIDDEFRALEKMRFSEVYIPLGIGHIDHRIVSESARRHFHGIKQYSYAEYPYFEKVKSRSVFDDFKVADVSPLDIRLKARAILKYESQIKLVFGQDYQESELFEKLMNTPELISEGANHAS